MIMSRGPSFRIAIISNQAFSLVNFRGPLILALVAQGVQVYALAPDYDEALRQALRKLGAEPVDYSISRAGLNPARDVIDMARLAKLLYRLRVDATLGYFIKPVIYGTLAAWLAGVPKRFAMIEGLGYVFTPGAESKSIKRRVLKFAVTQLYLLGLSRATKVFFLNDDDIDEFCRLGLVRSADAVKLGGIGVDLNQWSVAPSVVEPVTFLLAARLLREKGIVEYVEAARQVKLQHPETRFILLGGLDPNPGGLTRDEVESWADDGIVEWPGHVPVESWLGQASVYVLPSYYREGVPRSSQEAMAMGRPVITTNAPGCRETVVEGENGFLIPMRDVGALVAAMLKFIEKPSLIETMGRSSRRIAEERFDVHRVNQKILETMRMWPSSLTRCGDRESAEAASCSTRRL